MVCLRLTAPIAITHVIIPKNYPSFPGNPHNLSLGIQVSKQVARRDWRCQQPTNNRSTKGTGRPKEGLLNRTSVESTRPAFNPKVSFALMR